MFLQTVQFPGFRTDSHSGTHAGKLVTATHSCYCYLSRTVSCFIINFRHCLRTEFKFFLMQYTLYCMAFNSQVPDPVISGPFFPALQILILYNLLKYICSVLPQTNFLPRPMQPGTSFTNNNTHLYNTSQCKITFPPMVPLLCYKTPSVPKIIPPHPQKNPTLASR